MANVLDNQSRFWTLNSKDDILTTSPIKIRSIFLVPGTKGDGITFYQRNANEAAVDDINGMTVTVTNNETITDDNAVQGLFANAAVGDWVYIHDALDDSGAVSDNNNIWRYISAIDGSNHDYITVEKDYWGNLTNDAAGSTYSMDIYNPNLCIFMLTDDLADTSIGNGATEYDASITNAFRDFGDKGRWFPNLAMTGFTTGSSIYVEIM